MGLLYTFNKAGKIIQSLDAEEYQRLKSICEEIRDAEVTFREGAADLLKRCWTGCEGICCRNVNPGDLITLLDLVYIRMMQPDLADTMDERLQNESLFTANCIFLVDGFGPCLFPVNSRPEKCLISFCFDDSAISKEIRLLRSKFNRLYRFLLFRRARAVKKFLMGK